MKLLRLALLSVVLWSIHSSSAAALAVPPAPRDVPIVDNAEVLTPEQEQSLAQKITTEESRTGNQVGVLTLRSLEGEVIEDYSLRVARTWGIGSEARNSGVLIVVAVEDRKVRIEVGYGLEGALPDIRASQIIRERMAPAFREGKYDQGINSGVDGVLLAIRNERDSALANGSVSDGQSLPDIPWEMLAFALFIIPAWLGAILARTKSWWAGGVIGFVLAIGIVVFIGLTLLGILALVILPLIGLLFDKAVSGNYRRRVEHGVAPSWWAGGTHLGGGGGWGGFGGGSFGGGGASGDW